MRSLIHYSQAHDERAAQWLIRAGEHAQNRFAWPAAVERYRRAVSLLADEDDTRRLSGWTQYRIGWLLRIRDREESLESLVAAEEQGRASGDHVLVACSLGIQGLVHCYAGDLQLGLERMRSGVAQIDDLLVAEPAGGLDQLPLTLRPEDPNVGVIGAGTLVLWLAITGYVTEAIERGTALAARLEEAALTDQPTALWIGHYQDVYAGLALAYAIAGQPERAIKWFYRTETEYLSMGHLLMVMTNQITLLNNVILPYRADRLDERNRLAENVRISRSRAETVLGADAVEDVALIWTEHFEGRWEIADAQFDWRKANRAPVRYQQRARIAFGWIALRQGRMLDAQEHLRAALPRGLDTAPGTAEYVRTLLALDLATALALVSGELQSAGEWIALHQRWLDWDNAALTRSEAGLNRARYALINEDMTPAREQAEAALTHAMNPRQPLALLACHRFLGNLDIVDQRLVEAEDHLVTALELADACHAPYERALTLVEIARLWIAKGEREAVREALDAARNICEQLQARPTLEAIDELEAQFAEPETGADAYGLSPRELDVLRLLVEGKTDREIADALFLSPRTINAHMRSIRAKFGVDSRTAATAVAIRERLV